MSLLFQEYPRELGVPFRMNINSKEEFFQKVESYHTRSPIFTNLYTKTKRGNYNVNKLWIDFDGYNQYVLHNEVNQTIEAFLSLGIERKNIIVVSTGKKGYHLYVLLSSFNDSLSVREQSKRLHFILSFVTQNMKTVDAPLFSDLNRVVRVAGIQRPEKTFCFVMQDKLSTEKPLSDYLDHYQYNMPLVFRDGNKKLSSTIRSKLRYLELYDKIIQDHPNFEPQRLRTFKNPDLISTESPIENLNPKKAKTILDNYKIVLRKFIEDDALWFAINTPNPIHKDRIRLAKKLLSYDLDIDLVCDFIRSLEWFDFDPKVTKFHVQWIYDNYVKK